MGTADIAIAAIVLVSVLLGLWRGFLMEVLSLLAWVVAACVAMAFGPEAAGLFEGRVSFATARLALGYTTVFLATLIGCALVTWLVRKLVQQGGLSGTDRLLGLVFGLVRGVTVVVLLVLLAGLTPMPREEWWKTSQALPSFQRLALAALPALPTSLRTQLDWRPERPELLPTPPPVPDAEKEQPEAPRAPGTARKQEP